MPPVQNFTLIDLRAVALATALFSLFGFAPGYALGWWTNVLSFRQRLLSTRLLIAVVISVSVCPALSYLLGMLSIWAIWAATATAAVTAVILLIRELRGRIPRPSRAGVVLLFIAAAWVLIAIGSLVDVQVNDRLYFSSTAKDYSFRAPITAAISRDGVRPPHPQFLPGGPLPLRYHHYWYILCSLVDQLGRKAVSPMQALIAGTVWCGLALLALIPLYLRFFDVKGSEEIHHRSLLGVGLLAVTGLDLIPTVLFMKFGHVVLADMDWWNEQIASWLTSLLWVPHHVIALLACLTGFLLLWCIKHGSNGRSSIVLAACAFASAAGCSIYVTLVFASFLIIWAVVLLVLRQKRECVALLSAGLLAAVVSLPYLFSLQPSATDSAADAGANLVTFSIRTFTVAEILFKTSNLDHGWHVQMVNAALLPLNYFLELGFFFAIGWMTLKGYRKPGKLTRQQMALTTMLITSVAICTFVRSTVVVNPANVPYNDLGWRGFLLAQFVLLLWTVDFWPAWSKLRCEAKTILAIMLASGVLGTAYQGLMLRIYPILADQGIISRDRLLSHDRQLGRRTLAMRQGYARLQSVLPQGTTVQFNPTVAANGYFCGLYGNCQVALFDQSCGPVTRRFQDCDRLFSQISPLFNEPALTGTTDLGHIDVLVFQDTDPVWADKQSWIWQVPPMAANDYFRAIATEAITRFRANQK